VPRLSFPGGCLVGDSAGFVNVPRIKGSHNAILSGMLCADHVWLTSLALNELWSGLWGRRNWSRPRTDPNPCCPKPVAPQSPTANAPRFCRQVRSRNMAGI
jgi:hypothetical protein